jgi:hypothetical protein
MSQVPTRSLEEVTHLLFMLSNAWVAGAIKNGEFRKRSRIARQSGIENLLAMTSSVGDDQGLSGNLLAREFNDAVTCALAVEKAIDDLKGKAQEQTSVTAVRGYHVARHLPKNSLVAMRRNLG